MNDTPRFDRPGSQWRIQQAADLGWSYQTHDKATYDQWKDASKSMGVQYGMRGTDFITGMADDASFVAFEDQGASRGLFWLAIGIRSAVDMPGLRMVAMFDGRPLRNKRISLYAVSHGGYPPGDAYDIVPPDRTGTLTAWLAGQDQRMSYCHRNGWLWMNPAELLWAALDPDNFRQVLAVVPQRVRVLASLDNLLRQQAGI